SRPRGDARSSALCAVMQPKPSFACSTRGVTVQGDDPSCWTTMHIAAYEGAARSVPVLLRLGADINERTPVQRQQTPILTTFKPAGHLRARERRRRSECHGLRRKTACDWAELFKRDE